MSFRVHNNIRFSWMRRTKQVQPITCLKLLLCFIQLCCQTQSNKRDSNNRSNYLTHYYLEGKMKRPVVSFRNHFLKGYSDSYSGIEMTAWDLPKNNYGCEEGNRYHFRIRPLANSSLIPLSTPVKRDRQKSCANHLVNKGQFLAAHSLFRLHHKIYLQ